MTLASAARQLRAWTKNEEPSLLADERNLDALFCLLQHAERCSRMASRPLGCGRTCVERHDRRCLGVPARKRVGKAPRNTT